MSEEIDMGEREAHELFEKATQIRLELLEWVDQKATEDEDASRLLYRWLFFAISETMDKDFKIAIAQEWLKEYENTTPSHS